MKKRDFYDWEVMSYPSISYLMVKFFGFDSVETELTRRDEVESRIWITLKLSKDGKQYYVSGQRTDVVRKRLIEQLDKLDIRKDYLSEPD